MFRVSKPFHTRLRTTRYTEMGLVWAADLLAFVADLKIAGQVRKPDTFCGV